MNPKSVWTASQEMMAEIRRKADYEFQRAKATFLENICKELDIDLPEDEEEEKRFSD